jgi:hypothetical protein
MKKLDCAFLVCLTVFLISCAPVKLRGERDVSQDLIVRDDADLQRVEILLRNPTKKTWCLESGSWPTSNGALNYQSDMVWLEVNDQKFHIEEENVGYCGSYCSIKILSGASLSGTFPYARFHLPESLRRSPKRLVVPMVVWEC